MVKQVGLLLVLSLFQFAHAAEFSALAQSEGDVVHLKLQLSDIHAKSQPDLSALSEDFQVLGQSQSTEQRFINGNSSSSTSWDLTLMPLKSGPLTIPSIAVQTDQGEMKTSLLKVEATAAVATKPVAEGGSSLVATIAKGEVYKSEPVILQLKLTSRQPLRNIQFPELSLKDAIVEPQGQPKARSEIVNGRTQEVVTNSYRVTPLHPGTLQIPALRVMAQAPVGLAQQRPRPSSPLDSMFDDGGDPFAHMQQLMNRFLQDNENFAGFGMMKPVAFNSKPIEVKVLPPVAGIDPWLPAEDLEITEKWGPEKPKAGEPLTRTIMTRAAGVSASQLPGFEDQWTSNSDFKIYSDLPELSKKEEGSESWRKDSYTVIPQKSGELHLPALKIAWWDTREHRQRVATLPEHILQVQAGVLPPPVPPSKVEPAAPAVKPVLTPAPIASGQSQVPILAYVLAGLAMVLVGREWMWRRQKKSDQTATPIMPIVSKLGPKDLRACTSVAEVNRFLQKYAQTQWQAPANASVPRIFAAATACGLKFEPEKISELSRRLEQALYGEKETDLEKLKSDLAVSIFQKGRSFDLKPEASFLPKLNPS